MQVKLIEPKHEESNIPLMEENSLSVGRERTQKGNCIVLCEELPGAKYENMESGDEELAPHAAFTENRSLFTRTHAAQLTTTSDSSSI